MKKLLIAGFLIGAGFIFVYCTKNNQVVTGSTPGTNQLNAYKTATAPAIDRTLGDWF